MQCPVCSKVLVGLAAGDIHLEVCRDGCGGIWFDRDELFRFDEPHEFDPSALLQIAEQTSGARTVDHEKPKKCPKCDDSRLVRQFFDVKNEVELDQCWECAGVWLDVGEIQTIRNQFETHEDRVSASNEYIVGELKKAKAAMDAETKEYLQRLEERYQKNVFARAMGFFQKLIGVEEKSSKLMHEEVFRPDFDQFLSEKDKK